MLPQMTVFVCLSVRPPPMGPGDQTQILEHFSAWDIFQAPQTGSETILYPQLLFTLVSEMGYQLVLLAGYNGYPFKEATSWSQRAGFVNGLLAVSGNKPSLHWTPRKGQKERPLQKDLSFSRPSPLEWGVQFLPSIWFAELRSWILLFSCRDGTKDRGKSQEINLFPLKTFN